MISRTFKFWSATREKQPHLLTKYFLLGSRFRVKRAFSRINFSCRFGCFAFVVPRNLNVDTRNQNPRGVMKAKHGKQIPRILYFTLWTLMVVMIPSTVDSQKSVVLLEYPVLPRLDFNAPLQCEQGVRLERDHGRMHKLLTSFCEMWWVRLSSSSALGEFNVVQAQPPKILTLSGKPAFWFQHQEQLKDY